MLQHQQQQQAFSRAGGEFDTGNNDNYGDDDEGDDDEGAGKGQDDEDGSSAEIGGLAALVSRLAKRVGTAGIGKNRYRYGSNVDPNAPPSQYSSASLTSASSSSSSSSSTPSGGGEFDGESKSVVFSACFFSFSFFFKLIFYPIFKELVKAEFSRFSPLSVTPTALLDHLRLRLGAHP